MSRRSLAALTLLVLAGPVWGAEGFYGDCTEDFSRLCAKERGAGRPALRECIRVHKDELSDACRKQLRGTLADPEAAPTPTPTPTPAKPVAGLAYACRNEKVIFCADVDPKEAALLACLRVHHRKATTGCQAALDRVKPRAKAP